MEKDRLLEFFRVGREFSFAELRSVAEDGEFRYRNRIPPGWADQKAKAKLGLSQYGDLIIWKQMLELAKYLQQPLILVIDDLK